jgi:hypothetical protein
MKRSHQTVLALVLMLALALAVGGGMALAQSSDTGTSAAADDGAIQGDAQCPADCGPGGPGGPGHMGRPRLMAGGEVVSVEGDIITLNTLRGDQKQIQVNDDTVYRKDGADATLADVVAGEKIGVALTEKPAEGETPVAKAVMIGLPDRQQHPHPTIGEVASVDGNNITLNTDDGEKQFTLPEIQTGSRIGVATDADGNIRGLIYDPPEKPVGPPAAEPENSEPAGSAS